MNEELNNEFPWLIFSIHEEQFAINCKYVAAILHKNEEIVFVPHEHDYVKGLITFREVPIKLIDTRRLLNEESVESEMAAFNDMIEKRKEDHIRWVNELERCAATGEHFGLTTDPHKCAFGKWYDNFETDLLTIRFHMNKIEEPHRLLHESAEAYNACSRDCDNCKRAECLRTTVERAKKEYVAEVLDILDQAKEVFKDYYKEMIIAVETGDTTFGFLVDEVIAVEDIEIMSDFSEGRAVFQSKFFNGVAKRQKYDKLILLLDVNEMLRLQEGVEITHKQLLSLSGENMDKENSTNKTEEESNQLENPEIADEECDIDIVEANEKEIFNADALVSEGESCEDENKDDVDMSQQEIEPEDELCRTANDDNQDELIIEIEKTEIELIANHSTDDVIAEYSIVEDDNLSIEEQYDDCESDIDLEIVTESDIQFQDNQDDIEIKE